MEHSHNDNILNVIRLGIDTYHENIVFMREDCQVCKSEGFSALTRVVVHCEDRSIIATLNIVTSELIGHGQAALSNVAFDSLGVREGDAVSISHLKPMVSFSDVRSKMYGNKLSDTALTRIITDVSHGLYSHIELAAFITACAGDNLMLDEIISLTKAMTSSGSTLRWEKSIVVDKHCVGGLPGNRTTPIVVSIVAAAGLCIPKTSSRAITSPAGTADTIETMTGVDLSLEQMREVVSKEGGCMAWGGSVRLSPADDVLITVERALDVDSAGQMIASVLSKKAAAGSTHVIIDIPVGETAKVRTKEEALKFEYYFKATGDAIGLKIQVIITDGSQPVGKGIGPALEALDVLAVLRSEVDAPKDLKERAIELAGRLLEMAGTVSEGAGVLQARNILESGDALKKFQRICKAQGGFREPTLARIKHEVLASADGVVTRVDNRKLSKIAKLAGAPRSAGAGVLFDAPLGKSVKKGERLFTIYSDSKGELNYALDYINLGDHIIQIQPL